MSTEQNVGVRMTNEEYHKNAALGSTGIKKLLKSPYHYLESLTYKEEKTPAMILGSAIHTAILEPHLFEEEYIVAPEFAGKGSVAAREEFKLLNAGKTILTVDQFNTAQRCREAVSQNTMASHLLSDGTPELSFFGKLKDVACKVRPDYLRRDRTVIDVKSTLDADFESFRKTILTFGYHISAAMYLELLTQLTGQVHEDFIIIAVEKNDPSKEKIGIYRINTAAIDVGRYQVNKGLDIYSNCTKYGRWPGYPEDVVDMDLPHWAYNTADFLETI